MGAAPPIAKVICGGASECRSLWITGHGGCSPGLAVSLSGSVEHFRGDFFGRVATTPLQFIEQ